MSCFTDPATQFFLSLDPAAYTIPQNLTRPQELRRPQIDPATRKNPEMTRPRGRLGRVMTRPHASLRPYTFFARYNKGIRDHLKSAD